MLHTYKLQKAVSPFSVRTVSLSALLAAAARRLLVSLSEYSSQTTNEHIRVDHLSE